MFTDETDIHVQGGTGGDGVTSFRKEKYVPRGGPDGGDGGNGGDIVLRATTKYRSLSHLENKKEFRAEDGEPGGSQKKKGKSGENLVIDVPVGTLVKDRDHGHTLKDLDREGEEVIVAKGGKGGRGNRHFASATNQAPRRSEDGKEGEERWLTLQLKLIADAGLIGLPNAGKSTLLSSISSAHPKQAAYPFTTLYPVIGVVNTPDYRSFVLADLPGLIEGAHEGKGLGDRFLRHVERTKVLVHLIDANPEAETPPLEAYQTIREEIKSYSETLAEKPELVVASKMDLSDTEGTLEMLREKLDRPVLPISAATGQGLERLKFEIIEMIEEEE